jgi:site-specific DNA-methyltransferase (adenine-specific)
MENSSYNPDVLNCIANLSNDEVFTPPELANNVLDLLPQELFRSPQTTFLDPFTKSGVFLREIVKRLDRGLESVIPDRQERIDHILHNQVFGIACTELTSLLSRRSVYCSKSADGKYSVTRFKTPSGNILYLNINHTWEGGKCKYCGASQAVYDRGSQSEQYAYMFIHTDNPGKFFNNMKFDVIIGNPPYQLNDGGGTGSSATPLYHKFVEQAQKLKPRYLTMIIPSRWFSGGKGLDDYRDNMLKDKRISHLVDFFDSTECFPGVDLSGGVCYFLWETDYSGPCVVTTIRHGIKTELKRPLLEGGCDSFVRFNEAIPIIRKIISKNFKSLENTISARKPFGDIKVSSSGDIKVYAYPTNGHIRRSLILQNVDWIDRYKVMIAKAYGERGEFPYLILGKPFIGEPKSCCTETYLVLDSFQTIEEARSLESYVKTKFFRFLVLLKKNTQNAARGVYSFVPLQDFSHPWTDEMLYKKYGLTPDEIAFIESMIRPME